MPDNCQPILNPRFHSIIDEMLIFVIWLMAVCLETVPIARPRYTVELLRNLLKNQFNVPEA